MCFFLGDLIKFMSHVYMNKYFINRLIMKNELYYMQQHFLHQFHSIALSDLKTGFQAM